MRPESVRNPKRYFGDTYTGSVNISRDGYRSVPFGSLLEQNWLIRTDAFDRDLKRIVAQPRVYDFADGVIGSVHRVLGTALENALDEGRGWIEWNDIAQSLRARNRVSAKKKDEATYYDPFKDGIRKDTKRILEEEEAELKKQIPASAERTARSRR